MLPGFRLDAGEPLGMIFFERLPEPRSEYLRERMDRERMDGNEKLWMCVYPLALLVKHPAGYDEVDVGMVVVLPCPGMQHGG